MKLLNKIGLECEYFLSNKKGELVFPDKYGFSTDEFCILGEFRAKPGCTVESTIGNYFSALVEVSMRAKKNSLIVEFGHKSITPEFKKQVLLRQGTKRVNDSKNIYGKSILTLTDDISKDGIITECVISAGMHIHFSKEVFFEKRIEKEVLRESKFILTRKQMISIIRNLDSKLLPDFINEYNKNLKYRQPGFYEEKPWGFEYRSMPMCYRLTDLTTISHVVEHCFKLLEGLDK